MLRKEGMCSSSARRRGKEGGKKRVSAFSVQQLGKLEQTSSGRMYVHAHHLRVGTNTGTNIKDVKCFLLGCKVLAPLNTT